MKAAVYDSYGPPEVLTLKDVEMPVPRDNEVLIKIRASTVSRGDSRVRSLQLPPGFGWLGRPALGFFGPRQPILGSELAGTVEAVGKSVTRFKVGDAVFGFADAKMGCHAEYRCLPEDKVAPKPANLTWEQSAALPFGAMTALDFLRKAKLACGEKVLVIGASGAVGSACVQLARHMGAEVTGVCSTANVELVRSLGATQVIDYTREDFTQSGETWDVIIDTVGTAPYSRSKKSLSERGRLVLIVASLGQQLLIPFRRKKVIAGVSFGTPEDLRLLAELAQSGEYKAVIDRPFRLDQIVEAHRYVDAGHKKGSVVITV